jgi:hypothetical protein
MSKEAVEKIIGKAVLDSEFREALFADPEKVLGEYDLTEDEVAALKAIDFETLESFAGTLDDRISKMGLSFMAAQLTGGLHITGGGPGAELTGGPGAELTGGPGAELTGGPGAELTGGPGAELTGGPGAELTGGPGAELTGGPGAELTGIGEIEAVEPENVLTAFFQRLRDLFT